MHLLSVKHINNCFNVHLDHLDYIFSGHHMIFQAENMNMDYNKDFEQTNLADILLLLEVSYLVLFL